MNGCAAYYLILCSTTPSRYSSRDPQVAETTVASNFNFGVTGQSICLLFPLAYRSNIWLKLTLWKDSRPCLILGIRLRGDELVERLVRPLHLALTMGLCLRRTNEDEAMAWDKSFSLQAEQAERSKANHDPCTKFFKVRFCSRLR